MQIDAEEIIFGEVARRPATTPQLNEEEPVFLPVPGKINLGNGWQISAQVRTDVSLEAVRQNADPWRAFAAVAEGAFLWLRPSMPGERFQPLGMGGHSQAIQDLLSDRKVRRGQRPLWPVVATNEHPVWIVGQHLDERVRVEETSRRVVQLICLPNEGPGYPAFLL
jgi:tRNA(Ile)-lysidine synthase